MVGQELPDQPPTGSTQREAHGDLTALIGGPGEEEARQVGAGDQEDETDDTGRQENAGDDDPVDGWV